MRCPRCGVEAVPDGICCSACGSKLVTKPSEHAISPRIRGPEKRRPGLWLIIFAIGIAFVTSGMLVWWYEVGEKNHDSTDSQGPFRVISEWTSLFWALAAIALTVLGIIFIIAGLVLAVAAAFD